MFLQLVPNLICKDTTFHPACAKLIEMFCAELIEMLCAELIEMLCTELIEMLILEIGKMLNPQPSQSRDFTLSNEFRFSQCDAGSSIRLQNYKCICLNWKKYFSELQFFFAKMAKCTGLNHIIAILL